MARRLETSLLTSASGGPRPSRMRPILVVFALLAGAMYLVYRFRPQEETAMPHAPVTPTRDRMQRAAELERQSLYRSAADEYAGALNDEKLDANSRYQAALHLVRIDQDDLDDPLAAETALEKVWLLAPEDDKPLIAARIEKLRGYPMRIGEPEPIDPKTLLKGDQAAKTQSDQGRNVIAQVGSQSVTFEDLIYAWNQSHGNRPPDPDAFGPFVSNYLNMTLLADQAQRLGLDQKGGTALALRMDRTLNLSRAMDESLIGNLPNPTEQQLRDYYHANASLWARPPRMTVGHIVVADEERADSVERALKAKESSFAEVARRLSRDTEKLDNGYILGSIGEADEVIPHLGSHPGLASVLFQMNDNQTTGPLKLSDGYHWFKVVKKETTGEIEPFEKVRDQVGLRYQQVALAKSKSAFLSKLRAERPIDIRDATLNKIMAKNGGFEGGVTGASDAVSTGTLNAASASAPTSASQKPWR